jgi:divalent metal cation (Fe/Co/Zn/Cd) transporter
LTIALRSFQRQSGVRSLRSSAAWTALRRSKDPAVFTVIAEDTAALAGLTLAFGGIFLSRRLGVPALDGAASILIGALLAAVAVFLIIESRGLLVGEGVDAATADRIRAIAREVQAVEEASTPLTAYFGPHHVLLALKIRFHPEATAAEIVEAADRIESRVREDFPDVKWVYIEADALKAAGRSSAVSGA